MIRFLEKISNKITGEHPHQSVILINLLCIWLCCVFFKHLFKEKNLFEATSEHILKLCNSSVKYIDENTVKTLEYIFERVSDYFSEIAD